MKHGKDNANRLKSNSEICIKGYYCLILWPINLMVMQEKKQLRLDVGELVKSKLPRYSKYIPNFVINGLAKIVCQDELNEILKEHGHKEGVEFAQGVIDYLNVSITVEGAENLPEPGSGRFIFVSNHPLGGLDGLAIITLMGNRYNGNIKFLVNDLLMAVKPLRCLFLPINKFGQQSRNAASQIDESYSSDCQMLTFPAGLCSRLHDDGTISDLAWQKSFVAKAVEYGRDVVPMYFEGQNSSFFYRLARIRKRLKLKFNIEMMFLPREMVKSRGKHFVLKVGSPIPHSTLNTGSLVKEAARIRELTYGLAEK